MILRHYKLVTATKIDICPDALHGSYTFDYYVALIPLEEHRGGKSSFPSLNERKDKKKAVCVLDTYHTTFKPSQSV